MSAEKSVQQPTSEETAARELPAGRPTSTSPLRLHGLPTIHRNLTVREATREGLVWRPVRR